MEEIFTKVYDQDMMFAMKKFDPNKPEDFEDKKSFLKEKKPEDEKELQKYKEKVKAYTDYKIGRKLSENTPKFTETEIKSSNLNIKSSALMRVITKWCEELEECFTPGFLLNREETFRMKDGSKKFVKTQSLVYLEIELKEQKQILDKKLKQILLNNFESQSSFARKPLDK